MCHICEDMQKCVEVEILISSLACLLRYGIVAAENVLINTPKAT